MSKVRLTKLELYPYTWFIYFSYKFKCKSIKMVSSLPVKKLLVSYVVIKIILFKLIWKC